MIQSKVHHSQYIKNLPARVNSVFLAGYQQAKYAVAYSSGLSKPITNKELVAIGIRRETSSHILIDVFTKNIADWMHLHPTDECYKVATLGY